MASTPASAAPAPAAPAPARRQPTARGTPAARTKTKRWTDPEVAKLRTLYAAAEDPIDWDELADRLLTGRTGKQVQSKCTTLGLRQREKAAAGGPAWEAQRCHGTVETR